MWEWLQRKVMPKQVTEEEEDVPSVTLDVADDVKQAAKLMEALHEEEIINEVEAALLGKEHEPIVYDDLMTKVAIACKVPRRYLENSRESIHKKGCYNEADAPPDRSPTTLEVRGDNGEGPSRVRPGDGKNAQ